MSAAQTFNQANPDVQVCVLTWQQAGLKPFQAGGDTTAYIDAVYWWQQELAHKADAFVYAEVGVEGSSQGLVRDLSPYIKTDGGPTDADFAPGLLDRFRWQGVLWGLPARRSAKLTSLARASRRGSSRRLRGRPGL